MPITEREGPFNVTIMSYRNVTMLQILDSNSSLIDQSVQIQQITKIYNNVLGQKWAAI